VRNLDDTIAHVEGFVPAELPHRQRILRLLRQTRAWASGDGARPGQVRLIVTNAGGRSRGVTRRLRELGVEFVDLQSTQAVPRDPRRGHPEAPRPRRGLGTGAAAIATLLTAVYGYAGSRALAQEAEAIRRASTRDPDRRRIRRDEINLYNVETFIRSVFDRDEPELDQERMNDFTRAVDDWITRDYRPGGRGDWQRYFERKHAAGVANRDHHILGGELLPWLDAGWDLSGLASGGMLGVSERGNAQYEDSAIELVETLLAARRERYVAAARAADELSAVSASLLEEQLEGLTLSVADAYTLRRHSGRMGRVMRHYVSALEDTLTLLREARAVDRERWDLVSRDLEALPTQTAP
jgi:hypothetical protein